MCKGCISGDGADRKGHGYICAGKTCIQQRKDPGGRGIRTICKKAQQFKGYLNWNKKAEAGGITDEDYRRL